MSRSSAFIDPDHHLHHEVLRELLKLFMDDKVRVVVDGLSWDLLARQTDQLFFSACEVAAQFDLCSSVSHFRRCTNVSKNKASNLSRLDDERNERTELMQPIL